jgi:hypothetical protein
MNKSWFRKSFCSLLWHRKRGESLRGLRAPDLVVNKTPSLFTASSTIMEQKLLLRFYAPERQQQNGIFSEKIG